MFANLKIKKAAVAFNGHLHRIKELNLVFFFLDDKENSLSR